MRALGRSVLALLAGVVVAVGVIGLIEWVSSLLYPLPPETDMNDREAMRVVIANMPLGAKLLVLLAHTVGTAAGACVAALVAGRLPLVHGGFVGAVTLMGGIFNLLALPHPLWFAVVDLLLFLPAALLGAWPVRRDGPPGSVTSAAA